MYKLHRYNEKEKNNFKCGKVLVANNKEDIIKFVKNSIKEKNNSKLFLGKIGDELAKKIMEDINIDIENYNLSLKSDAVRHILNRHSNEKEFLRGQLPVNQDDFKLISRIISNYDRITITGKTMQNKPIVTAEKTIDNRYYLISYISNKNHTLEVKTMYKRKKKGFATGDNA